MIFKNIIDLSKNIDRNRSKLWLLAKDRGLSDPDVIKISQELDEVIIELQKVVNTISSPSITKQGRWKS